MTQTETETGKKIPRYTQTEKIEKENRVIDLNVNTNRNRFST